MVKQWKKLLTKKERDKSDLFLIEGFHLVEEALKNKRVVTIIKNEYVDLPHNWNIEDEEIFEVPESIVELLAETETTQGIFAVCEKKELVPLSYQKVLMLDGVQDPGNLGTIIRTADAAGVNLVILGEGCVDLYNGKVLRSTQGSVFHLPVMKGKMEEWIVTLKDQNIPVYGTSLENAKDYREISSQETFALIMGNEGNGVRKELLDRTDQNLYIPIFGQAESLNVTVATGILLYALNQ
ncbi:TrmH family RNA methyltransferase [Peribacillus alkalitolerans]|uniref:TrmH family RNA methyltransferase n=1 Tax=Peribacillus alkalitolerans TaxID=1550385 RepID=UPI001967024E|nr:RNA methyltransferase [Peribacillus alkalitolerans]